MGVKLRLEVIMSITINNNSYNYTINGIELEPTNRIDNAIEGKIPQKIDQTGNVEYQTCRDRKFHDVSNDRTSDNDDKGKDFFITNYNDTIAKNFGLIFDARV